jgi:hypothetical protein
VAENDHVRVLRAKYGPGEKSVMHDHPAAVAVFLTDVNVKFTSADGTTEKVEQKAGEVRLHPVMRHSPENLGDKPIEVIVVELKDED